MSKYPLDPRLSRALIASKDIGCSDELLTIIALLSVDTVFQVPHDKREQAHDVHRKFHSTDGDHVTLLNVWRAWNHAKCNQQWAYANFLNNRNLLNARDIRQQLLLLWQQNGAGQRQSCGQNTELLRKCLARGYGDHVAVLQRDGTYKAGKLDVAIHPSSCLLRLKPEHLLYTELLHTNKLYMRNVSVIDPKWIS